MPFFDVTFKLVDSYERETVLTRQVDSLDIAAAQTAAGLFNTDLAAISDMRVLQYSIAVVTIVSDTVTAGANKDEGATFQLRKADNQKVAAKVPAPIEAIRNPDGTIDVTHVAVTDYFDNYLTGDWRLSDGEVATELIKGTLDV